MGDPEGEVRGVLDFVGEEFEPSMLDYHQFRHDFPKSSAPHHNYVIGAAVLRKSA